jgi:hypothetical protein
MLPSGLFTSVCSLSANVLEHPVCSIFIGAYEDGTECSKMLAFKIWTPVNNAEESTRHSEHGEITEYEVLFDVTI